MSEKNKKPNIDRIVNRRDLWGAIDLIDEGDLADEGRDRLVAMMLAHHPQYFDDDDPDVLVEFDFNDRVIDLALEENPYCIPHEIVIDLTNNISHDKRLSLAEDWELEEIRRMVKMGDLARSFLNHVEKQPYNERNVQH